MEFIATLLAGLGETKYVAIALFCTFIICFVGYAIGAIKVKGLSLGTAGVFLFALLFGYLMTLPQLANIPFLKNFYIADVENDAKLEIFGALSDLGLVLFVTSVGCIAGPNFFRDLKRNAKSYVPMGAIIVLMGAAATAVFALIPGIGAPYATGVLSGALTSTPAFSAAKDAVPEASKALVSLGHAVAYPFGVVGVVLFVQIMPRLVKADMKKERELIAAAPVKAAAAAKKEKKRFSLDEFGFGAFGLIILSGILLGSIKVTPFGIPFSLGMTGGPLLMGLIWSHFGHIGPVSLKVDLNALKSFREFGLMLFLVGAGVEGGAQLVDQVGKSELGIMLVVYGFIGGAIITIIPMIVGYIFARFVCKLPLLNNLGSITGGMTSTPALGSLIGVAGTDDVATAYASTYPLALVLMVLSSQLINTFLL